MEAAFDSWGGWAMTERGDHDKPLGIRGLLGVGLDNDDGHTRITRGPNFYLIGGSQPTHERMQEVAVKFNEKVTERDKRLQDINARELKEIVNEIGES